MCTVSIVPYTGGLRLISNRDERRERAEARAPQSRIVNGVRAWYPIDPDGGGSWCGVNDAGLAVALLNRNQPADDLLPARTLSRGVLVPLLLEYGALDAAIDQAAAIRPADFKPFTLILVRRGGRGLARLVVIDSDAARLRCSQRALDAPVVFSSSSLGDDLVDGPREALFRRLLASDRGSGLQAQARFHRHQWPERPDLSVCMERWDARTVSRTVIDIGAADVSLGYEPLGLGAEIEIAC